MAKILEVKYENLADAVVCEVHYETQADLCWYEVGYAQQAEGDAKWFFRAARDAGRLQDFQDQVRDAG